MKEGNKFPAGGASLPRPELNPLTNPVLGRNLGRWAQVYFTSPPEKREQAVTDLLRELETEPASAVNGPPAASAAHLIDSSSPVFSALREARDSVQPTVADAIECASCRHVNSTENRYCGFCGGALGENIESQNAVPASPPSFTVDQDHELEWLRNKELASFQISQGRGFGWVKYAVAIVGIAIAGFLYLQTRERVSAPVPSAETTPKAPAEPAAQPVRPEHPLPNHDNDKHLIQEASLKKEQTHAVPQPPSTDGNRQSAADSGAGDPDLRLAQTYLQQRNGPEAARLLWRAVGRNNTEAALTLSQLYARGDGVSKNCDQARILLVAAAKRGSSAAAQQLRQFDSAVCR